MECSLILGQHEGWGLGGEFSRSGLIMKLHFIPYRNSQHVELERRFDMYITFRPTKFTIVRVNRLFRRDTLQI